MKVNSQGPEVKGQRSRSTAKGTLKMCKEKDKGKRELPPAPPIEKRETEKESNNQIQPRTRVRTREETLPPVIDIHTPPSLELLLAFAHLRCHFFDDAFTREWHRIMTDELFWCNAETGRRICHWPAYFRVWRENRKLFEKLRDPDRIPDARKATGGRKADNWRGTRKEDIGNVLG